MNVGHPSNLARIIALYGGMMNGIQVVDLMLDRAFNDGNSLFTPKTG